MVKLGKASIIFPYTEYLAEEDQGLQKYGTPANARNWAATVVVKSVTDSKDWGSTSVIWDPYPKALPTW